MNEPFNLRFFFTVLGLTFALCSDRVLVAAETPEKDLPGYYEFFTKTGQFTRLTSEVKRDDQIQAGKISPVVVNEPVIDLRLPDGFGHLFGTRDSLEKKHLVLITGRAWW